MKYVFAGTPEFAAWTLEHLCGLGRRPLLVITRPDRPVGRGRRAKAPPAALAAQRLGLDLRQPDDINAPAVIQLMRTAGAEALVVASFGQKLRTELLESLLCLNVHASLLPAYRGAAPIERAVAAGEERTGVSIMRITEKLDAGPWALQTSVSVSLRDDAGSVGRALALLGAQGIHQVLTGLDDGTVVWTEQVGEAEYAQKLCLQDCLFDTAAPAKTVHDRVRALSPKAGARASSGDLDLKIWRTWPYGQPGLPPAPAEAASVVGRPGELLATERRLFVGCGEGVLELLDLQPSGRSRMHVAAFLRGYRRRLGSRMEAVADGCVPTEDDES